MQIAAAEPGGSNLWSHHLERLLNIFLMRNTVSEKEEFPFVVWWVCCIDLYALFSGAGSGEFVGMVLKNDMIPAPNFQIYPLDPSGSNPFYSSENDTLPTILQLNYDVFILAAKLGLLASEFRQEENDPYGGGSFSQQEFSQIQQADRRKRLVELQQSLKQLWQYSNAEVLEQQMEILPPRSRELVQHVSH